MSLADDLKAAVSKEYDNWKRQSIFYNAASRLLHVRPVGAERNSAPVL